MPKCEYCGDEFNITSARRCVGRYYGAGSYDNYYPDGDVCEECALEEISADIGEGEELTELMGDYWDD